MFKMFNLWVCYLQVMYFVNFTNHSPKNHQKNRNTLDNHWW